MLFVGNILCMLLVHYIGFIYVFGIVFVVIDMPTTKNRLLQIVVCNLYNDINLNNGFTLSN